MTAFLVCSKLEKPGVRHLFLIIFNIIIFSFCWCLERDPNEDNTVEVPLTRLSLTPPEVGASDFLFNVFFLSKMTANDVVLIT